MQIGVAQQWYDELDNLAFSTPETALADEENETTADTSCQDDRIHIHSAVNTSPGTSEVCSIRFVLSPFYLFVKFHLLLKFA